MDRTGVGSGKRAARTTRARAYAIVRGAKTDGVKRAQRALIQNLQIRSGRVRLTRLVGLPAGRSPFFGRQLLGGPTTHEACMCSAWCLIVRSCFRSMNACRVAKTGSMTDIRAFGGYAAR